MPQVGIGFLPDIGGTYFPRLLGSFGTYLADGAHHQSADAVGSGWQATTFRRPISTDQDALATIIRSTGCWTGCIAIRARANRRHTPVINRAFSATTIEEILDRLDAEEGADAAFARETAAEMSKKSPTSLKIALAQMQRGGSMELRDALKLEFRLASHVVGSHDYREGVAARLAGKGRAPQCSRARLADVDKEGSSGCFRPSSKTSLSSRNVT
jgi:enoyl-CoA hydratase